MAAPSGISQAFESKLVPNTVTCPSKSGYSQPISTYCGLADYELTKPHFLISAIEEAVAGEPIVELKLAFFAFSDLNSAGRLCNLLSAQTTLVSVSAQKDTRSENTMEFFGKCAAAKGAQSFLPLLHGLKVGGINSYHPKLVFIETPNRRIALIGSGNLSSGRKNIDYAVVTSSSKGAKAVTPEELLIEERIEWVNCTVARFNHADFESRREDVLSIRSACQAASEHLYLMPSDSRRIISALGFFAGRASVMRVVTQGFNSPDISAAIRLALREGVSVQILLDDDMHWANINPNKSYMNEQYEYLEYLHPLIKAGAKVRYVVTNHNDNIGNFQHAKGFSLSTTSASVALLGSANSTSSAFADNLETMIHVKGKVANEFNEWFDALWKRSIEHDKMPLVDPLAAN
jgi:HKD family nuclease